MVYGLLQEEVLLSQGVDTSITQSLSLSVSHTGVRARTRSVKYLRPQYTVPAKLG